MTTEAEKGNAERTAEANAASEEPQPAATNHDRALHIAALLAVAAIIWITRPVGVGVVLGMLTAFTLAPFYGRLRDARAPSSLAAFACVLATLLAALAALGCITYLLIERGSSLARAHAAALAPGGSARHLVEQLSARLPRFGIQPDRLVQRLGDATTELSMRLAGAASAIAGATVSTLLGLLFLLLTCYYVLQNWNTLIRHAAILMPLDPRDTRELLNEFRRAGRSVLLGTVLTGIAQGILAGLGYYLTRVPEPAFFGTLTAIASLLPGIGTFLIWIPVGIVLMLTRHFVAGGIELVWGAVVVVGFCDYVLRPRLVGRSGELPGLVTLIALFGGLSVFGMVGLILGPVIMSLAIALLRIYEREEARQHPKAVAGALVD